MNATKEKAVARAFDIGDCFMDRYTIVIGDAAFGMSDNPLSPVGFNQFCCTREDLIGPLGREVKIEDLPEDVQKAIKQRELSTE